MEMMVAITELARNLLAERLIKESLINLLRFEVRRMKKRIPDPSSPMETLLGPSYPPVLLLALE